MDKHDTRAQGAGADGRANGQVRVWDPLVRIGHWLLVAAFFTAYIAGDDAQTVHVWAGYTVAAIIAWRIVWGVVGSRHARFTDFVRGPGAALAYLRGMASGKARRHLGHNPAGGLMILALIASLAGTTLSGMSLYAVEEGRGPLAGLIAPAVETTDGADMQPLVHAAPAATTYREDDDDDHEGEAHEDGEHEGGGDLLESLHKFFVYLTLGLVALHVLGVIASSLAHAENLVRAMITGRKRADDAEE